MDDDDKIAVVGVAARVPGASCVDAYWLNLVRGTESVTALSDEHLRDHGVSEELLTNTAYVKTAALMPDTQYFDADLFAMTPREAQTCDPQIRLFLEAAHTAIENAGYDPTLVGAGTAVFASAGAPLYDEHHLRAQKDVLGFPLSDVASLNLGGYIATMTSYKLNLQGPSVTVQTACSSTLVALHLACQSLRVGDCDTALVGGASIDFPFGQGYLWSEGGVQSRSGHCRPFDAEADGTVFGGGACAVMLKRLPDALADHDHIRAVIRGSAINNDGSDKVSFGAPNAAAQSAVVREALTTAGVRPGDISYVEAHGTGTGMGDPIEIRALTDAFNGLAEERLPVGSCSIGSVKGNIGHLGPVAGLAGLIKTILALEHEQLPPSINYRSPHPRLDLGSSVFRVQDRLAAWPRDPQRPRRACVSSMGIGGSNAHVVLEEPPSLALTPHQGEPRLVVWSSPGTDAERTVRTGLAEAFLQLGEEVFADAVATLQHGRGKHPVRAAAVCTGAHDAATTMTAADTGRILVSRHPVTGPPSVSLLFPGQGSQHVQMARGLYRRVPTFTRALDEWLDRLDSPDLPLRDCWRGVPGLDVNETSLAQPLLFATELALAHVWQQAGVRPAALLGHSLGELAAATVAGVFEPDAAASLVLARARAMRDHPAGGGMLAVASDAEALSDLLCGTVTVAVINRTDQVVLAGSEDDLADVAAELSNRGVACTRLPTSGAFHTPLLGEAARTFEKAFAGVTLKPPILPVYSAATGRVMSGDEAVDPAFWANQLVGPVQFATALDALVETGPGVLLEVGPEQVLSDLARRHERVRNASVAVVPTLPRRRGGTAADDLADQDITAVLTAAAHLWTAGTDIAWEAVGQAPLRHRIPLPGYPYQRERHWVDAPRAAPAQVMTAPDAPVETNTAQPPTPSAAPLEDGPTGPFSSMRWASSALTPPNITRAGTTVVVFLPSAEDSANDVVAALKCAGMHTIRVRPADAYRDEGGEFAIRPGVVADIERVFDELARRGIEADLLVHALAAAPWPPATTDNVQQQLDDSFFSALALAKHGLRTSATGRVPELIALTSGAIDVSGADPVDPVKAAVHGLVRTLHAELPRQRCKVIDFSSRTPVDELREEICRVDQDLVVALRGRHRWVPREAALQVAPDHTSALRSGGVYVITGGMGALGLATMRSLAATGIRPRIALLGRTLPAAEEPVDAWSAEVRAAVHEATALGAEVRLLACDVGDPRQVRRALDIVAAAFGPVQGLLHLAGVAGNGILQTRDPAQAAEVLRPKVHGTVALAEALAGRPELDWAVLFSSRAAVDGLVGGGDYAAANAVMDLCARPGLFPARRVLSVNYPSWASIGMASRPNGASAVGELHWTTTLGAADTWALDEHRLDDIPILPGTAHLDLVTRAYGNAVPAADDRATVLRDVVFVAPLVARRTRRVTVVFVPDGTGHRFEVRSQLVDDTTARWVSHATGRIERRSVEAPAVNLASLREATRPAARSAAGSFTLGPRWSSVLEVRDSTHERLLALRLPAQFTGDLRTHPLHPALLDLATSALRGAPGPGPQDRADETYLPFLYRALTVFAPLQEETTVRIRKKETHHGQLVADVEVIGCDGLVLVAVEGFTMRRTDRTAFGTKLEDGQADPEDHAGIAPSVGTDILLKLLSSRTPDQVLIRPHRNGRPVPVAPPASGQPAPEPPSIVSSLPLPRAGSGNAPTEPMATASGPATDTAPVSIADRLRGLWARTLGHDRIAPDDDFFDLGGDSLTAIELMTQIREAFDIELTVGFLFEAPTLAELAEVIDQRVR
ncbi:type I polyketide synthase [Streptomyces sp. SID8379]|uniref:type I polyketide synthase n=1 Tax=unclassified Streptomyces TaxID=2593676 RepID=UPI000374F4A7|nr:type I polyketide synthase [Streptomyces sp. HmicA12]MYW69878.1 type I polyketide synthase [Streptomyces sp. SID8379]